MTKKAVGRPPEGAKAPKPWAADSAPGLKAWANEKTSLFAYLVPNSIAVLRGEGLME